MIGKIRSVIDGNPYEVLILKLKKALDKNYRQKKTNQSEINLNKIYNTPIIINSMNRLTYLREQINWLEKSGLKNLIILDNQSTFLPLLEYYDKINYRVIKNQKNNGYLSLWFNEIFFDIQKDFYIYTDSDIVGSQSCPKDFIEFFYQSLFKIDEIDKVGFSLNLEGINQKKALEYKIFENENKFWKKKFHNFNVYKASIDTTFALYRPYSYGGYWLKSGRTGYPYVADHLPWYDDVSNNEEREFYENNIIQKNSFYQSKRNQNYK